MARQQTKHAQPAVYNLVQPVLDDGDPSALQVDASGNLRVNIVTGAAAGGTSQADESAYTPTSTSGTPIMGARDDTSPDTVAEDKVGIARITTNRAIHVNLRDDAGNEVSVGGGTQYTEDAAAAANPVGTALNLIRADTLAGLTTTDGDNVSARGTDKGELYVKHADVMTVASHAVTNAGTFAVQNNAATPAGTNNIGDVDVLTLPALVAGTANIGDVDVLSLPAIPAGTNNIGDVDVLTIAAGDNNIGNVDIVTMPNVTLAAGTNTNEVVGDAAHDAAVAGNPVLVGGIAETAADSAPGNRASADGDSVRAARDLDGSAYVLPHGPQLFSYHSDGSSALTDASVHAAPGAGLALYITDIVVGKDAATAMNVFFEEGAAKVLGPWYLEAVAGRGLALQFRTPKKITVNTALTVTTSAAIAHSVDVLGYIAPG